jgi:hypothetical protein
LILLRVSILLRQLVRLSIFQRAEHLRLFLQSFRQRLRPLRPRCKHIINACFKGQEFLLKEFLLFLFAKTLNLYSIFAKNAYICVKI